MSKKIVIIGGGIIGLCSAYYLQKEGHEVTVIDKSDFTSGASFVNAGYLTPSHIISLAAPGIITKGIKWMFNSESPFYVKPRLDAEFLKWSLAFKKSANAKKVESSISVIRDINLLSRDLYDDLKASKEFDFHYERKGLLMAYKTDKAGEAEWKVGQRLIEAGLNAEMLTKEEIKKREPNANLDVKGGVFYDCDAHTTPSDFMPKMLAQLKKLGVKILAKEEVEDLEISNKIISKLITNKREIVVDQVVLAAGSWSPLLSKKLGLKLLIQAGKGYRINLKKETGITIPTILLEAKVAVTPMNGFTRFAGTMEIGGINHDINPVRVNAIAKAGESFYKGLKVSEAEKNDAQCGLRPCSPDGLPFIGKSLKCNNLTIATGHAMMGWSLGPATGKLVSEIISEKKTSLDLNPFHPDRKF
ncbi:MAG: FAD-dependent oxidoreductase [Polaribacter sp.]|nr:FAD-dependent oxidoreductase [Polaribacter sp.]MDG1810966.1 FAD-dependent oxidoreductase [Polaribacter sp.]MDG1993993.1 FAD-dependent oxidoreductase [Polaribacter sp.]